jgi:hypothetical protein
MAQENNPVSTARSHNSNLFTVCTAAESLTRTGLGIGPVWALVQMLTCNETVAYSSQFDTSPMSGKFEGKEINTDVLVRQFVLQICRGRDQCSLAWVFKVQIVN